MFFGLRKDTPSFPSVDMENGIYCEDKEHSLSNATAIIEAKTWNEMIAPSPSIHDLIVLPCVSTTQQNDTNFNMSEILFNNNRLYG